MDVVHTIALSMGVGWASGINLYAAVFMLGFMGSTGYMELPPELQFLSDPLVLVAAGFMYLVEFFADKTPGVDSGWDAVHTFIRIPAGAALAAGAVGDVSAPVALAAGLVGGTLAAGSHVAKAGARAVINTSPEPFTNWAASLGEDVAVIAGLWAALNYPVVFLALLVVFVILVVWLLPKIWRALKRIFGYLARLFGRAPAEPRTPPDKVMATSETGGAIPAATLPDSGPEEPRKPPAG
jgi:hypothetical protein